MSEGIERISGAQIGKPVEVPVTSPQLLHAVTETDCRDPDIVDGATDALSPDGKGFENLQVIGCLADEAATRMRGPVSDHIERDRHGRAATAKGSTE